MKKTTLSSALKQFDIAEANLLKLERLYKEIIKITPSGIVFGSDEIYEYKCRLYKEILLNLPSINGWKPTKLPRDLNYIAQSRLDAQECGEISLFALIEEDIEKPGAELREYRFLLNQKRKELTRDALLKLIDLVDGKIRDFGLHIDKTAGRSHSMSVKPWEELKNFIEQIDTLLGSSVKRPERWAYLHRHLRFAMLGDFYDIKEFDWPEVKNFIQNNLYGVNEPIPADIEDLSFLINQKPTGSVTRKLQWEKLSSEEFERLIFSIVNSESDYENAQWLTQTDAPDRGRDISVDRIIRDSLSGITRQRVIIQCKHWLKKSISGKEISQLEEQMKLWEPPKVDVLYVVTSGRFTSDAVTMVEKRNQSDRSLRIEMWPESHIEMILASRPALIQEFNLK